MLTRAETALVQQGDTAAASSASSVSARRRRRALSEGSARSVQRVLFSEYVLGHPHGVPQRAVATAMQQLGFSPEAARQALSRAVRDGAVTRIGRAGTARVALSEQARRPLLGARAQLDRRLDDPEPQEWLVLIVRGHELDATTAYSRRTNLLLNGMGSLGGGVWVRPKTGSGQDDVAAMLDEDPGVHVIAMTASFDSPPLAEIAGRAWDIEAITAGYDTLVNEFANREASAPEDVFRAWTEFVDSWQRIAKLDPALPAASLGTGTSRPTALTLLDRLRTSWRPTAQKYFDDLVG